MEASPRFEALASRHAELERDLETEMKRPMPDAGRVATLKKEKRRLKDEMQLSGALTH
jgi:hypothetical protein